MDIIFYIYKVSNYFSFVGCGCKNQRLLFVDSIVLSLSLAHTHTHIDTQWLTNGQILEDSFEPIDNERENMPKEPKAK